MKLSSFSTLITKLPIFIRELLYFIYLLKYLLSMIKTFFVPKREKFSPAPQRTNIPRFTDEGVVFDSLSDAEIAEKYAGDDALKEDAAYLISKGVEPRKFSGSVISPLDAVDRLSNAISDIDMSSFSKPDVSNSSSSSSDSSTTSNSEISNS